MANPQNPYAQGLFVKLEGEAAKSPRPGSAIITLAGQPYDMSPWLGAIVEMGRYVTEFGANTYNPAPLLKMQNLAQTLRPSLLAAQHAAQPIRQAVAPMVHGMSQFMQNSQKLIQMRLKTSHQIARAPKILIPVSLSIASGASSTGMQIRNPYLGASGGATGIYQSPWAITSFRTSNGESGALLPIRITQFLLGGHDYVAAALSGITYTVTAAPATQGWPAAAFAETKRSNWKTEIQPWNVVATHGGGTGFGSVMTETGFLQLGVFNGGSQTYVDTYSVYCNATLCGSPFAVAQWTQVDAFRKSFAPLNMQVPLAMRLAGDSDKWAAQAIDRDDPNVSTQEGGAYLWANRLAGAGDAFSSFLENAGPGLAMGDTFYNPQDVGFSLPYGASYEQT